MKDLKNLRHCKKMLNEKICKQNFSELTEVNYNVVW
jgi:hypothetical protein